MRAIRVLLISAMIGLCHLGMPTLTADDKDEKARREAMIETLRKTEPTEKADIDQKKANDQLIIELGKAEIMELFRLNPKHLEKPTKEGQPLFHGYEILVASRIEKAEQRTELVTTLGKEFHWFEGWRSLCFSPRHGLRVIRGKETLDLVICFECSWIKVYNGAESQQGVILLGEKWEAADKILQAAEKKK